MLPVKLELPRYTHVAPAGAGARISRHTHTHTHTQMSKVPDSSLYQEAQIDLPSYLPRYYHNLNFPWSWLDHQPALTSNQATNLGYDRLAGELFARILSQASLVTT